ncbi:HEAT repeat domain-containing protein [Halodesulfovibrio sp.]|jgi:HEAT repeat protein|uniref:HEAT repeat domain-containing protein n=1 Tax=Halodesulfovibrio sp. TaxID=1912772 RepID=UPI0025DD1FFD|nr:HEAT repeat domain-containing protein [Halodesulfovibrio sp.]MCT4536107.1 HEAT repeat domain-containing protein [Halodesulfovibrio sp.]
MSECDTILSRLRSDDSESVRDAAYVAGTEKLECAIPELIRHIQEGNLGVQEAADRALRVIRGEKTVQAVIPLLASEEAPVRNAAMDILREVAEDDLESVMKELKSSDPDLRIFVSDILGSSNSLFAVAPLCDALLKDEEVNVRYQAAVSLGELGFADAADSLIQALGDEEWVQFSVIEALTKIGAAQTAGALVRALSNATPLVASMIVEALGEMGDLKIVPLLVEQMKTAPAPLQNKICKAVVQLLGDKTLELLPADKREQFTEALLAALEDEDEDVQLAALRGLSTAQGDDATRKVMSTVITFDVDRDTDKLLAAVECLAHIGCNSGFLEVFHGDNELGLRVAAEAVSRMSHDEMRKAIPTIISTFEEKNLLVQRDLITVLAAAAGSSEEAFFQNVLISHSDELILKKALYFLGENSKAPESAEIVFAMLSHESFEVKDVALEAAIAMNNEMLWIRFVSRVESEDPTERMMAVYALGKSTNDVYVDLLKEALSDPVVDVRLVAFEGLIALNADPASLMEQAKVLLNDDNRDIRIAVVDMIGKTQSDLYLQYLIEALDDEDDWVVVRAVEHLGALGNDDVVEPLLKVFAERSALVQHKVVKMLGNLGTERCFGALLTMMSHDDPEICDAAEQAANLIRSR